MDWRKVEQIKTESKGMKVPEGESMALMFNYQLTPSMTPALALILTLSSSASSIFFIGINMHDLTRRVYQIQNTS